MRVLLGACGLVAAVAHASRHLPLVAHVRDRVGRARTCGVRALSSLIIVSHYCIDSYRASLVVHDTARLAASLIATRGGCK